MQTILKGFGQERLHRDPAYAKRMIGALKYWLDHDYTNPNWWHNEIGMPLGIGNITILLYPLLNADTVSRAAELVGRGSMATLPAISQSWTGANLIWGALNTVRHALLTGDSELLRRAVTRASAEITEGAAEGIQLDRSFFQHGPRLYAGGYGLSFAGDIARLLYLLQETAYQLPADKIDLFLSFILDGLRHMIHSGGLDWACVGRELTRPGVLDSSRVMGIVELLTHTEGLPRKDELVRLLTHLRGGQPTDMTRYFPDAAMLCHHFNGLYVGAKFMNDRTLGAEICNSEGELCCNMSYGTHTCIMSRGREYRDINPVWDYTHIPGTTSFEESDTELLARKDWVFFHHPNKCFGGQQNGRRAVIYQLAEHDGIKALVTHFAFEDGYVCLGAGITNAGGQPLVTTVDQCWLAGDPEITDRAVTHNGIRYTSPDGTVMDTAIREQVGSWKRNNAALSDRPVKGDVLTLTISHPAGRESAYAYVISAADRDEPSVEVLRNDRGLQAIRLHDGAVMAVFHEDGSLTVSSDGDVISGTEGQILC
jgi:chondroitin AC lyase